MGKPDKNDMANYGTETEEPEVDKGAANDVDTAGTTDEVTTPAAE